MGRNGQTRFINKLEHRFSRLACCSLKPASTHLQDGRRQPPSATQGSVCGRQKGRGGRGGCGEDAAVWLWAVYQARKQRADTGQGWAAVGAGMSFPILLCEYIQSVVTAHASGKSCVFYPDQTGLSP